MHTLRPINDQPAPSVTWLAVIQFVLALVWLSGLALVLHLHERPEDKWIFFPALGVVAGMYPFFWAEALWRMLRRDGLSSSFLWAASLPIVRIGVREPRAGGQVWLPRLGWRMPDEQLVKDVDRMLSTPMLLITLAVLPVVTVEYGYAEKLVEDPRLAQLTEVATAIIWWAFTVEFALMVSLTPKKLAYCKQHWLDIIVILLPVVMFLRALRLGRLLRLNSLTKTVRVYKLRGVLMKTYRALLLVDAIARLLHGRPEKRLQKLRQQLSDQEMLVAQLRADIAALEASLEPPLAMSAQADELAA